MAGKGRAGDTKDAVVGTVKKAGETVKDASGRAAKAAKGKGTKTVGTVKAAKAAGAGRVKDARKVAATTEVGAVAERAIAQAEALHYEAVVNKRGLSMAGLTRNLNERWDNGWRLAHAFEQRGNTVLVFEKRG